MPHFSPSRQAWLTILSLKHDATPLTQFLQSEEEGFGDRQRRLSFNLARKPLLGDESDVAKVSPRLMFGLRGRPANGGLFRHETLKSA